MKKNLLVLAVFLMLVMVGCNSKPTLFPLFREINAGVESTNAALADAGLGLHVKYSADGEDALVISYIYEEYQVLTGRDQSEIDDTYAAMLDFYGASTFIPSFFEKFEEDAGIILKCIRAQFVNADGTVIYSQDYYNTK